jgi:hypothetical protein
VQDSTASLVSSKTYTSSKFKRILDLLSFGSCVLPYIDHFEHQQLHRERLPFAAQSSTLRSLLVLSATFIGD